MWFRLCASAVCDVSFFLLYVCFMWFRLSASVSHSDGLFFLLGWVPACGPVYALVYPIVMGYSSVVCVFLCGSAYALVYPIVMSRPPSCVERVWYEIYRVMARENVESEQLLNVL
jgi:hypothetical protein